ncbi:MAG: HAD family phosphatase [Ignavibacteriales bacterium]|nr:HAD family phosphatase [Ignavibacteriales bacterium]
MYSVIVFDLGNVLLPFDYSNPISYFNGLRKGLGDNFIKLYMKNYHVHREFESGILSEEQFLRTMLEWVEHTVTGEQFCKIFSDIFTVNQKVVELIPLLKEKYKVVLLSNTNSIHKRYGYGHLDFLKWFDQIFLSHEVSAVKPEEKIYRTVESYTQKKSSEHFFIDDIQEYVDGAKKFGWDGVQFVNYEKLIEDFTNRRIL